MSKRLLFLIILSIFLVACTTSMMVRKVIWERYITSEAEVKEYLEKNYNYIDPIEGIWTVNSPDKINYAKVAIIRDTSSLDRDFLEVVLSSNSGWLPNTISAYFSNLAYEKTYVSKQFSPYGSSKMYNFFISHQILLVSNKKKQNHNIHTTLQNNSTDHNDFIYIP